eukprot:TRINITY_DN124728_c0_g2_i3.p1 TRINITY_DN124728_c0_g2~~TRINITY_DN124728_c0_g2_i3.p1  ORF type:complete len:261 (+),score=48.78 TRINITY_DN124728_c0_g2_i3:813-1595(+)
MFDYCINSTLNKQPVDDACPQKHFLRTFFWVEDGDIQRVRNRPVKTVKGTRALHAVKCLEQNVILTRELSCFCEACRSGVGDCTNTHIAGAWCQQTLTPAVANQRCQQPGPQAPPPAVDPLAPPVQHPAVDPLAPPVQHPAVDPLAPPVQHPSVDPLAPLVQHPAVDLPLAVQSTHRKPVVGDFVEVRIEGRQRMIKYFGKVLDLDETSGDVHVHFLAQKAGRETSLYVWSDDSWVTREQIVNIVNPPKLAPSRGIAFVF